MKNVLENECLLEKGGERESSLVTIQKRTGAEVHVYLLLRDKGQILLSLRSNTGYCDGYYGLVAGHVEDHESALAAVVREAHEEIGLHLDPLTLRTVHVMHRKTDRFNIDIFVECSKWSGEMHNCEPDKCGDLAFFPENNLPPNTIDYIQDAFKAIARGDCYSEQGWA